MEQPPGKPVHIVVIEDNPSDVELLRMALDSAGLVYDLTSLRDGGEALAFFRQDSAACQTAMPDLVILDLNLPKYDGMELLEVARANPKFAQLPIMVLSSSSSPRELARIQAFGLVQFVSKPSDLDRYLRIGETVKEFLTGSRAASSES